MTFSGTTGVGWRTRARAAWTPETDPRRPAARQPDADVVTELRAQPPTHSARWAADLPAPWQAVMAFLMDTQARSVAPMRADQVRRSGTRYSVPPYHE